MQRQVERVCDQHPVREECPDVVVSYSQNTRLYLILIHDGEDGYASSGYGIDFCPWCGSKLPEPIEIDLAELDD
jgi:hypothetical protein